MKTQVDKYLLFIIPMLFFVSMTSSHAVSRAGRSHAGGGGLADVAPTNLENASPHLSIDSKVFCDRGLHRKLNSVSGGVKEAVDTILKRLCSDAPILMGVIDAVGPPARARNSNEDKVSTMGMSDSARAGIGNNMCSANVTVDSDSEAEIEVNRFGRKAIYYFGKTTDGSGVYLKKVSTQLSDGIVESCD